MMKIIYVKNKKQFTSIPISDSFFKRISNIYTCNMSLGFIMDFRHFIEKEINKNEWALYPQIYKENGEINIESDPLNECLAGIYYIFNYLEIDFQTIKAIPKDIAFIISHIYYVLSSYYQKVYDNNYQKFYLDVDSWNVVGYLEHIK